MFPFKQLEWIYNKPLLIALEHIIYKLTLYFFENYKVPWIVQSYNVIYSNIIYYTLQQ